MFADRFTAFVDACSLAGALRRNLLLTLAEAEFFRLRWSGRVLDETENAIATILTRKDVKDALHLARRARDRMDVAFEDAMVDDYDRFTSACIGLPDQKDTHVVAAALKTQATVIVTENLKHFPDAILGPLNIVALTADVFIADTITLDPRRAVAAIHRMRERLKNPEKTAERLLTDMEATGLTETADVLRPFMEAL